MAKIIHSHTECGYRKMGTCLHDDNMIVDCMPLGEQLFPTGCPLEDGMTIKQHLDDVLAMHTKPGTLYSTIHKTKKNRK